LLKIDKALQLNYRKDLVENRQETFKPEKEGDMREKLFF